MASRMVSGHAKCGPSDRTLSTDRGQEDCAPDVVAHIDSSPDQWAEGSDDNGNKRNSLGKRARTGSPTTTNSSTSETRAERATGWGTDPTADPACEGPKAGKTAVRGRAQRQRARLPASQMVRRADEPRKRCGEEVRPSPPLGQTKAQRVSEVVNAETQRGS